MSKPKYEQLKQNIKHHIRQGIWKSGEKLPVEERLCEEFGVSKITVKKAKQELIVEGVLESLPGRKGTFVRKIQTGPASEFIGVAIDNIQDRFRSDLLHGIGDKLWENKFHTIFCHTNFDYEKVKAYFDSLLPRNVAGVIFSPVKGAGYVEKNMQILEMLTEYRIPYVLLDRYIPNLSANAVVSDNEHASNQLTRLLLNKGHRRILVLAGVECSSIDDRLQGHLRALKDAGVQPDRRLIVRIDDIGLYLHHYPQSELEQIRTLVHKAGNFTACYAMNMRSLQVVPYILSAKSQDLEIPAEIATYDDLIDDLRGLTRHVTIVEQPGYRMGWEAARLLIEAMQHPEKPIVHMALKSKIIEQGIE